MLDYFGQGILSGIPGEAPYGHPMEIISMGTTHIPLEVIVEYIESLKSVYTPDKYHLLDSNCNDFSNALCQFLVGKTIPGHILSLPANFLNTPFGQSLRPMIEGMFGPSRHAGVHPAIPMSDGISPAGVHGNAKASLIQSTTTMDQLNRLLSSNRCVAIDFTSQTCAPCRIISPEFERLIQESVNYKPAGVKNVLPRVTGVKVETGLAMEISRHFNVMATPTFMFFLDGKKFHEFRGASVAELKSSIDLLQFTAYPRKLYPLEIPIA